MGGETTPAKQTQQIDQKQSGSSTTGPSEFLQPYLKQAVEGMTPYLGQGAPSLYPGSLTTAQSPDTLSALTGMREYGLHGLGDGTTTPLNTSLTNATLQGDYLNLDKNPYFQGALEASLRPATENFANKIIPTLRSTFAGAGRPGAGLEGTAIQDATTNFDRSVADASAKVGAQMYGDERQRMLATQQLLPQFQGMDLQRLGALGQVGTAQDTQLQKGVDEAVQRWNYGQTGGLDFLTGLAQRLQAAYPGGYTSGTSNTSGTTTATGTPASNPGAGTLGTIFGGLGTAASIASMFMGKR